MDRKPLSKATRFDVFNRDGFQCQYCGRRPPDVVLEVDHREPVAKGGTDRLANLVTSCSECNGGKSDKRLGHGSGLAGKWFMLVEGRHTVQMFGRIVDDFGPNGVMVEHADYVMAWAGMLMMSGRQELFPRETALRFRFYTSTEDLAAALNPLHDRMDREDELRARRGA